MFESKNTPAVKLGAPHRTVLFLDIDDVVCLNNPYGGYDVALALSPSSRGEKNAAPPGLWDQLFDATAREYLQRIDDEFSPFYVLSTSWWWLLDRAALEFALRRGGLAFVSDNLHNDWATPKARRPDLRSNEIDWWLNAHPEATENFVVLDDELSGTGLGLGQPTERQPFIVLCRERFGLTEVEYNKLRKSFLLRTDSCSAADWKSQK